MNAIPETDLIDTEIAQCNLQKNTSINSDRSMRNVKSMLQMNQRASVVSKKIGGTVPKRANSKAIVEMN